MVSVPDWLLLTAQWVHLMGAVTWVGGSIFFKFVLQPAFRRVDAGPAPMRAVGHEFGRIVWVAIGILVVTGAFMAVVHLTAGGNSRVYIGILALKIALAFYMFLLVWLRRRSASTGPAGGSDHFWPRVRRAVTSTTVLLILGIVVIGLADVLSAVGGHADGGHEHGGHGNGEQAEEVEAKDHVDAEDATDDHHKAEEVVVEETEVAETPEPTEEAEEEVEDDDGHHHGDEDEEEEDDGHGHGEDEEEDGHGHSH